MTSYIVWAANQVLGSVGGWVGKHPAEATLITAALANPATRGITIDVLRIVVTEAARSWVNITRAIGTSIVNRSVWASTTVNFVRNAVQRISAPIIANPVTTAVAVVTLSAIGYVATADKHGAVPGILMGGAGFSPGVDPGLVSGAESSDEAVRQYWGLPSW